MVVVVRVGGSLIRPHDAPSRDHAATAAQPTRTPVSAPAQAGPRPHSGRPDAPARTIAPPSQSGRVQPPPGAAPETGTIPEQPDRSIARSLASSRGRVDTQHPPGRRRRDTCPRGLARAVPALGRPLLRHSSVPLQTTRCSSVVASDCAQLRGPRQRPRRAGRAVVGTSPFRTTAPTYKP